MFDATLTKTTLHCFGKDKDKQTPPKYVKTVSEQVQGIAQQQGVYTIECLYPQSSLGLYKVQRAAQPFQPHFWITWTLNSTLISY